MDDWASKQLAPWLDVRVEPPVGPLFCVANGPHAGLALVGRRRPHPAATRRPRGRPTAAVCAAPAPPRARRRDGPRRRAADRYGHTNLGIASIYLQGIDNTEIIDTVHARRAPMVPVDSSLRR
jgi:integrase/recombinase XerD